MNNLLAQVSSAATGGLGLLLAVPQATVGYQPTPSATASQGQGSPPPPPPAFVFNYEGEQTAALTSDITDEYVEDNTAIQDNVALKPVVLTTQGFIGELNNIPPMPSGLAGQIIGTAANALSPLAQYAPGLSVTAQNAYNEAFYAIQVAMAAKNAAVSAWNTITGTGGESVIGPNGLALQPNQNAQQTAFQLFFGYWSTRTLFTVQTPWAVFQNMAILNLKAIQDATTNVVTDFEITFKQMRFAAASSITYLYNDPRYFASRLQQQASPSTNLGTNVLSPSPTSFSTALGRIA